MTLDVRLGDSFFSPGGEPFFVLSFDNVADARGNVKEVATCVSLLTWKTFRLSSVRTLAKVGIEDH